MSIHRFKVVLNSKAPSSLSFVTRRSLSTAPSSEAYLLRSSDPASAGISFLTLNRPAAKNALSMQLLADMRAALEEVRFDGCVGPSTRGTADGSSGS